MVVQKTIPAVLDEEMRGFLEEIEEIDRVEAGKAKCLACGSTVAVDSIRLVVPLKNRVGYVDDRYECVVRFTLEAEQERLSPDLQAVRETLARKIRRADVPVGA